MKDWKKAVEQAEHYLAVGQEEVYLDHDTKDYPWHLTTECEPGGSHRLDITTSVWFRGVDPSGLRFRWTFDIEPPSANGKGHYQIDEKGIAHVLSKLPDKAKPSFRKYLKDCVKALEDNAQKYKEIAERESMTAAALLKASEA